MALSNIRKEPKRELIESGIGTLVILVLLPLYIYVCHRIVMAIGGVDGPKDWWFAHFITVIMGPLVLFVGYRVLYFFVFAIPHVIGEEVCALLKSWGFDPRPKYRPGQGYDDENQYRIVTKESWRAPV